MLNTFRLLPRPYIKSFTRINLSKMSTNSALVCPKFIPVEVGGDICSRSNADGMIRFSLVSYNILAQAYVKSSLFPHSPSPCLKWKNRSKAILTVLENLGADFLCLQELDEYSFYKENMVTHGYTSTYVQRSGQKRDGCGIFYKNNYAELLIEETIEYNDLVNLLQDETISCADEQNMPARGNGSASEDHGDLNDPRVRLKRDCVGIMAAFRLKDPFHHVIIVANTHLYWDPELADVKLAQAKYLSSRLVQFKMLVSDRFECEPSVIVAGDFNSVPGDEVYQYLTSGHSTSASAQLLVECLDDNLPIPLCSLHALTRGEPPFTNCTPSFTDTLDYIFFSPSDRMKPVSILELPDSNSPDVAGGLPNYSHPSDHLPIGAEFEITRE